MDALRAINKDRAKKEIERIDKASVHRFINGVTHQRGRPETRGRGQALSKEDVKHVNKVRKNLLKKQAQKEVPKRVLWEDVYKASGLTMSRLMFSCHPSFSIRQSDVH